MAKNSEIRENAPAAGEATIALDPAASNQPRPTGDATCDLEPEAAQASHPRSATAGTVALEPQEWLPAESGDATCDLAAPPAPPQADLGTVEFANQSVGDGTCDFSVDQIAGAATHGPGSKANQTTNFARRPADPTPGDATGEYRADTEALADHGPSLAAPGDATCDISDSASSVAAGPATSLRSPGKLTQPASPAAAASAPQGRAGRYLFKKFHAKGGMGEVWLAEDSDIGRPVALKRMLKGREKQKNNFVKEAQVTGQLEHPGIIPVHELSLDEHGQPYYVMKFVHGQTLKEVIDDYHSNKTDAATSRDVQWLRLLTIFVNLCQTIAYAHSRGVIHRDIKPDNVMIGAYGETLVLDWGLAKVVGEPESSDPFAAIHLDQSADTAATMAGSVKGTPFYFAPEVAAGKVNEVDQISDVYLLGGTLYQMITGTTPRTGKEIRKLLEMVRTLPPIPPRKLDPTVPKALDAICRKALAHEKKDRYPTAAALAEDIQCYLAGEPVSAYQETLLEKSWRWIKRNRVWLGRAAAALLFLAVGATFVMLIRNEQRRTEEARIEAANLQRRDDARKEINSFRAAMEEARFYAASADPVAEFVPSLDAAKVDVKAKDAFDIADKWGPGLDQLPLEDQRNGLKKDIYDLLLEVAQVKSRRSAVDEVKKDLAKAVSYHAPTQSYYRLRARVGQGDEAIADQKKATDPQTPTSALDHYLAGEQLRVESLKQARNDDPEGKHAGIEGLRARRESLEKAIQSYRQALRDDPNHYWSHFQIGTCLNGLGFYKEAAEALGSCVALNPKAPWGFSARGLALVQIKDRARDAEADLNQALLLAPEFRPARLHRAVFYANKAKALKDKSERETEYKKADADFEAVLAPPEEKRLAEANFARGQVYMDRSMFDKALVDFEAVAANKNLGIRAVNLNLTRAYLVQENSTKALEALSKFLDTGKDFKPDSSSAYEQRGRELRTIAGEFKEARNRRENAYLLALAQLQKAVELGGETASLYGELGSVKEKLAELQPKAALTLLKQAAADYTKGIELAPKDRDLLTRRGWLYVNLNENEKAKDDFAAAVALEPSHAESYAGLGYAEAMLKMPAPARRHATLAMLHGSGKGDYLVIHNVACIYGALSKNDLPRASEYQDLALDHLHQAVTLWIKGGKSGPNEIDLIKEEVAFPPALRKRPEFIKLVEDNS